jgi:hypothetical protein
MVAISLTAKQAQVLRAILENVSPQDTIWIFSGIDDIRVEQENAKHETIRTFKIFEDGKYKPIFPVKDDDDNE